MKVELGNNVKAQTIVTPAATKFKVTLKKTSNRDKDMRVREQVAGRGKRPRCPYRANCKWLL